MKNRFHIIYNLPLKDGIEGNERNDLFEELNQGRLLRVSALPEGCQRYSLEYRPKHGK